MIALQYTLRKRISPEQVFMLSAIIVNGGNYLYNLLLGRILGPEAFADAAILITLLLVLSFIAMTFQLVVAKFTGSLSIEQQAGFLKKIYKKATIVGCVLGMTTVLLAQQLQTLFQTSSFMMFVLFGIGIPIYFIMSINRGKLQGDQSFIQLSVTYQLEMVCRLLLTFALLLLFDIDPMIAVSVAILISFLAGIFPFKKIELRINSRFQIADENKRSIILFFIVTACYELTQIICNNSDILLVKHFFPSYEAGLYASLALIGRVVYFVTWMFIMMLLPKVVSLKKKGEQTAPILFKYLGYILLLAFSITGFTFLFPELSVRLLFGEQYISIAPLLGWYAVATSLFALSNLFAYYFLSIDTYIPIVIAAFFGILQVILIICYHDSLMDVVIMQIIAMGLLLVFQVGYYVLSIRSKKHI